MILLFLALIPLSLYAMFPSFRLGLFGDDWIAIWKYFYNLGPSQLGLWGYLTHFLTRYGSLDIVMGLLVDIVGYKSVYFYIMAYFLRMIASLSFFPLVYYLTESKLAAFFSVLFFAVTAVGLDTTTWVFNMPVYLSVATFNLFLLFFVKSRKENNYKFFVVSLIFFTLSIFIVSVRMTGALPFVILVELFWLARVHDFKSIKVSSIRVLTFLGTFYLIALLGQFVGLLVGSLGGYTDLLIASADQWSNIWGGGLLSAWNLLNQGRFDFIFYPLITIGNMLLPIDPSSFKSVMLIIGGLIIIIGLRFIIVNIKNYLISTGLFLSLTWLILSFILAWIRDPVTLISFAHRYLIISAAGLSILLSIFISLGKSLQKRKILFLLFSPLIFVNIYSSRNYLNYTVNNLHGSQISEKIWSKMPYIPNMGKTAQPLVFHFVGENATLVYGSITFGFPYHMALLYNIDHYLKMPVPMGGWDQVISAVTDGKSFAPYGHPLKPIPVENVYAFRLEGKDNLINITDQVRDKLSKLQ